MSGFIFYIYAKLSPTKKNIYILSSLLAIFFHSCGSGNEDKSLATTVTDSSSVASVPASAPAFDSTLTKGKVSDSIACKDNSQSYAVYLPSYYSVGRKFPCIYFFDAHARGSLPVNAYKGLAEKYGFVLIGSNASKNGTVWEAAHELAKALMDDTRHRINIDSQRIYTAGFSGGSRVASSIALVDGGVAGVIGCAAGFPVVQQDAKSKFAYFGIVGDRDFNLGEMEQWDENLHRTGFAHQLLTTSDTHGWPSVADMQTALLWLQVMAMKEHVQAKNDTVLTVFKNDYTQRISIAKASKDWIKAHQMLDGIVSALDGLSDVSAFRKQLADMNANSDYNLAASMHSQFKTIELSLQKALSAQFTTQDETWWKNKIAELGQNNRKTGSALASQMNGRLLAYTGFIAYMHSVQALKDGGFARADTYLKIFRMADPKNPDCAYLRAVYYQLQGNSKQAISSLSEAASLGYNDVLQLLTEPAFSSLKGNADLDKIIAHARTNNNVK